MDSSKIRQNLKPWMLPIAMIIGIIFHDYIGMVAFLSPYLIFIMLLITFCRVSPKDFKVTPFIWALLSVQILGSIAVYLVISPFSPTIAQGVFICVLCPTAISCPRNHRNAWRINNLIGNLFIIQQCRRSNSRACLIFMDRRQHRNIIYRILVNNKQQSFSAYLIATRIGLSISGIRSTHT